MTPFFSIIVASYNASKSIEITISSVLKQSFKDYEIIVKDGASTDDTLSYVPESDRIFVYSSKDGGIYEGMNEGIEYAKGKYLCFLNCGDYFVDDHILQKVYDISQNDNDCRSIFFGDYTRDGLRVKFPSKVTAFSLYRRPICHQSMFFGKEIFNSLGKYDTQYRICSDYNHTVRAYFEGLPFVYVDSAVCDYLGGGASETKEGAEKREKEKSLIRSKYYSKKQKRLYDLRIRLSFPRLRKRISSSSSPQWLRKLYRKIVNLFNG